MKESEFNALVRLLEDEDPEVARHVEAELLAMGGEAIPRLEAAWEVEKNSIIQSRLEEVIHDIQSRDTLQELLAWFQEENPDLLYGWYLVSRYQFPNLELAAYKNKISRIANRTWLEFRRDMNIGEKLMVLNKMIFGKEQFNPNQKSLHHPSNYFLNTFFDKKEGSPISLGILYLVVCKQLEIPIEGILLPGYFVVHYKDYYSEFFLDVFNQGAIFVRKDLKRFLEKMKIKDDDQYYEASSKREIMLELIRSILFAYQQRKEEDQARPFARLLTMMEREIEE